MGTVALTRRPGGIAVLTTEGAIDLAWTEQLREHATALAAVDDVRAVLISGEGKLFCPGGDLRWMAAQPDAREALLLLAGTLHEGLLALAAVRAPVVVRVHAAAAGAGVSLAMAADLAIAGERASFTLAYTAAGLSPDGGSTFLLPRLVGRRRAAELMLTNRRVGAAEAERIGLVNRTVPDADLDAETDALVARLAAGPTAAFAAVKRLLDRGDQDAYAAQLHAEAESIATLAAGPTGQEGVAAFLAKRAPDFSS